MSESKHTQSKWSIERDWFGRISIIAPAPNGLTFIVAQDIGGEIRKDAQGRWTDQTEVEANARLLCAAPDLLAVLQRLWMEAELTDDEQEAVKAVLAKAQGAA
jgi:hypothetical protein